jgi:hypothetical protein
VFGRDNNYFENFQNRYDFFRVSHLLNKINVINTEEYFFEAKEKLSQFKVWENKHITAYQHRLISFINSCETFEEYKVGYPEIHLVYLRDENRRLTKKRKELKRKVKSNKKKNRKLKKSYKSLLKSSSWRATSFLRRN